MSHVKATSSQVTNEGLNLLNLEVSKSQITSKSLKYPTIFVALSTKMSQLGHYETIRIRGNMHWERSSRAKSHENDFIDNV